MLHVQWGKPQTFGNIIEAVRRSIFGKIVLQRQVDCEQIVECILILDTIQAAKYHTSLGLLPCKIRGVQVRADCFQKRVPSGGIGPLLGRGRHLLSIDVVKDLDPSFKYFGIAGFPGKLGEIESALAAIESVRASVVVVVDTAGANSLAGFYTARQPGPTPGCARPPDR